MIITHDTQIQRPRLLDMLPYRKSNSPIEFKFPIISNGHLGNEFRQWPCEQNNGIDGIGEIRQWFPFSG